MKLMKANFILGKNQNSDEIVKVERSINIDSEKWKNIISKEKEDLKNFSLF
jgi:hypothetical protein